MPKRKTRQAKQMWAVGPANGAGWIAINAKGESAAIEAYGVQINRTDHVADLMGVSAIRMPHWDERTIITSRDWLAEGFGFPCSKCGTFTNQAQGGRLDGFAIVCAPCAAPRREAVA